MNVSNKDIINNKGLRMIIKLKQRRNNYYDNQLMIAQNKEDIINLVKLRNENTVAINEILTSATKMTKGTQLPSFKMTNMTMGATTPDIRKSFLQTLSKKQKNGEPVTQIVGKGSKAFRELFGEVDDARESIYNGIGLLSTIAKRSEFLEGLLKKNDEAIANKTTQLFYSDKTQAIKNLGAGGLNKIVSLDETLAPLFKDGILVNRLKGMYTTKKLQMLLKQ